VKRSTDHLHLRSAQVLHSSVDSSTSGRAGDVADGFDLSGTAQHAAEGILALVLAGLIWLRYRARNSARG